MSIKCGHCKERHDTVAEVRRCCQLPLILIDEDPDMHEFDDLIAQADRADAERAAFTKAAAEALLNRRATLYRLPDDVARPIGGSGQASGCTPERAQNVPCDGCEGDGRYRRGYYENGIFVGSEARCYRCSGTGTQTPVDVQRNRYYDNHVRRIY